MARVRANNGDKIYKIEEWLGVNENPEGDTGLRLGEAALMTNFKITNNKKLQKRPGTQNIANLLFNYSIGIGDLSAVLTELNVPTASFIVYPSLNITDGGILFLQGSAATVDHNTIETCDGCYWQNSTGLIFRVGSCVHIPATGGTHVTGGAVSISDTETAFGIGGAITVYSDLTVSNGAVSTSGSSSSASTTASGANKYHTRNGIIYKVKTITYVSSGYYIMTNPGSPGDPDYGIWPIPPTYAWVDTSHYECVGWAVGFLGNDVYEWRFSAVSLIPGTTDSPVRGIWSGRVANGEVICAACNGRLWVLSETNGTWSKTSVGLVDTTNNVYMFGFDTRLYILNGVAYSTWAGTAHTEHTYTCLGTESGSYYMTVDGVNYMFTLTSPEENEKLIFSAYDHSLKLDGLTVPYTTGSVTTQTNLSASLVSEEVYDPVTGVTGYRPLIAVSRTYDGASSSLCERVNMLNGKRRVWFSPDGAHSVFTLPETGLMSIDYVKYAASGQSITMTSSNLSNGTVTLSAAPPAGTNSVEIGYSAATSLRCQIEAMTLAEYYNGQNDNRIFLYGDGSNKAFYSGLDYNGKPTAEYFPDLNVVHIGEDNTPLYDLLRHYNELIAFKDGSAHRIKAGRITLDSGVDTAAFYVETINKGIGGSGYKQAQLVENHPRTLDGRSIYEWIPTTTSGGITADQRNARRISQKVESTMRELNLTAAMTFYDKIGHEYFIVDSSASGSGVAIVQNTENGAWYVYRDFPAVCMIVYKDEVYYGTADGYIRHLSHAYRHDCGAEIACYWESGAEAFGKNYMRKYTDELYIVPKQEDGAYINVALLTDEAASPKEAQIDATGYLSFPELGFNQLSFNVCRQPKTHRKKIKAKGYTWLKLIFSSVSCDTTATLLSASIKVRETGKVR